MLIGNVETILGAYKYIVLPKAILGVNAKNTQLLGEALKKFQSGTCPIWLRSHNAGYILICENTKAGDRELGLWYEKQGDSTFTASDGQEVYLIGEPFNLIMSSRSSQYSHRDAKLVS